MQLYVSTPQPTQSGAPPRPIRRLAAFSKVTLAPGETKTVTMPIKLAELAFLDQSAGRWTVDPGRYTFTVGRNAGDERASGDVEVSGTLKAVPSVVTVKPTMEGDVARDVKSRVEFPPGVVVKPAVTVAMSDDTLYGAIRKGQARPLPPGMTVSYVTDDPRVASVASDGTIRTVGPGVATLTTTVSYQGVTRSRDVALRVVPAITDLRVDGKPLAAFQPGEAFDYDTTDYDVIVSDDTSAAPHVTATAADAGASVTIEQAGDLPGTARVTVSGEGYSRTYTVSFAKAARSDAFDGAQVGRQWRWVRQDPAAERTDSGALRITAQPGDLAGITNTARNVLVQPAVGDWTMESKLDFSVIPHADGQQAGIIAYQGDDDYVKLGWEFSSGAARLTEVREDSLSGAPVTLTLASLPTASLLGDSTTLWLRMEKNGVRYRTYYSADGRNWRFVYETGAALRAVNVGVYAYQGTATAADLTVAFDGFRIVNGTPAAGPGGGSPGGGPGGGTPGTPVGQPRISHRRIHVTRKRFAQVKIRCGPTSGSRCRGVLTLVSGRRVAAERSFAIRAGRFAAVRVRIDRRVYRRLVRERTIRTAVTLLTRGADGRLRRATATVTLVAPRKGAHR